MKTIYIPKGAVVSYGSLHVEDAVVHGTLYVDGPFNVIRLSGKGQVSAQEVQADEVSIKSLRSNKVIAKRMALQTGSFGECVVSETLAASVYLEADSITADKLITTKASITSQDVREAIVLKQRPQSMLGVIIRAAFRSFLLALITSATTIEPQEQEEDETESTDSPASQPIDHSGDSDREALLLAYDLLKAHGFRLEVAPARPSALEAAGFVWPPEEEPLDDAA